MATLQQQVQQHLDSTGISLRELSRRSGVSHNVVSRVLQGKRVRPINHNKLSRTVATARKTLDATVEQLAAQCVNADLTHHADWDTDLQCAKYRRVMQLEQQLNDANTAYLSSKSQHERDLQRLNDANTEIKRLTALSEMHAESWKAACVRSEHLQKQLDHCQAQFANLHEAYNQQVDDEREMLAQIDTLFVERENAAKLHDQQIMRLRVRCFALICAIVPLIVSSFVVWGGV